MAIILFAVATIGLTILSALLIPKISIENLLPISYLDILPVLQASVLVLAYWTYITIFFIFGDNIIGIRDLKKQTPRLTIYFVFSAILLLATMYGIVGSALIPRTSYPYLLAVEQIELLNSIQGFETILLLLWIFADFMLISAFSFACLHLIKYIFNLEDANLFTYIFTIIAYYLSLLVADNYYQLVRFSYEWAMYVNLILFFIIPILMSWINKIRNKAARALLQSKRTQ